MRSSLQLSAGVLLGLMLAGCSGVSEAPKREAKPIESTVVIKVPGMT